MLERHACSLAVLSLLVAAGCTPDAPSTAPTHLVPGAVAADAKRPDATLLSESTWGGIDSDVTEGAAVGPDGSTVLVGFTRSFGGTAPKLFAVNFAPDGSLAWERTWDGPGGFIGDEARDVAVAPDGSVYVVGSTFVDGNGALILKFSSTGSLLWQRTWGGNAAAAGVAVGSDGSAYVTGASRSIGAGEQDVFVLRLSPDGALVWARTWGSAASNEEGQGIALGPDGTVHVAAVAPRGEDPFAFRFDAVVLALDPDGNLLRQRAYPAGDQTDARGGIAVTADGAVYVAGGLQEPSGSSFANDGLLLKIASDGSLVWARSSDIGFFDAVTVAPDGHVVVVGQTSADPGGDAFLLRVGTDGRTTTAIGWGGAGLDAGKGVGVAADGTLSLAAVAEQPPYLLASASGRMSRARVSVTTPVIPLATASAPLADPAGLVETPAGSTTYAGGFEAALVRLAP